MDRVERRITKRNEIEQQKRKYAERFHEFASLGEYKKAMVETYRKTIHEQTEKDERTNRQ
ncbi:hypothetical protein MHZ92_14625 [Sporosarcina sp. ACRSL]|uniref:hypothetical protein n=1 Tax=Sporosarcina sp. ACRSL TaxID=2918215 RepID=UPI001EF44512|nr:hypothetical protein [Sporosarcina sp. ACRSL]MCG7345370.1 hypothetical protein [Sporosarcina sp. ACRSL]